MFRQRTRRFLFILTPVAALTGVGLSVYLKIRGQQASWGVIAIFIGVLAFCAGITSYYTFLRPLKDSSVIGRLLFKHMAERVTEYCTTKGVEIRLNIMVIYRPARCLFCIRRFRIRWHHNVHHGDGTAEFRITKGVVGRARQKGNKLAINMEDPKYKQDGWGFSKRQLKRLQFPDHTMIWAFPIYELDRDDLTTSRILGMVNLDSLQHGAYTTLVSDEVVRNQLEDIMEEFQEVVMKVASC